MINSLRNTNVCLVVQADKNNARIVRRRLVDYGAERFRDFGKMHVYSFGRDAGRAAKAAVEMRRWKLDPLRVALLVTDRSGLPLTPQRCKIALRATIPVSQGQSDESNQLWVSADIADQLRWGTNAVSVPIPTESLLGGSQRLQSRSPLSCFDPNAWYRRYAETIDQSSGGSDDRRSTVASLASPDTNRRFILAAEILAHLLTVNQNQRNLILRRIHERQLRESLLDSCRAIFGRVSSTQVRGIGFGVPFRYEVTENAPVALQVLEVSHPQSKIGVEQSLSEIHIHGLGSFSWTVEAVNLEAAAAAAAPRNTSLAISVRPGAFGTLGAFVRRLGEPQATYGLTCAHVVLESGDLATQVNWHHDQQFVPVFEGFGWHDRPPGRLPTLTVDAAIIGPISRHAFPDPPPLLSPIQATDPSIGMQVRITGSMNNAQSIVRSTQYLRHMDANNRTWRIGPAYLCDRYTEGGDSGAIVFDQISARPVGIHTGRDEYGLSFFLPITNAIAALALA